MAESHDPSFDQIATTFADYGLRLRGFIRYKLTKRNLEPFINGKAALTVLDIGGGHGPDTVMLAEQGHTVLMLEPSRKQRDYALRRFNFFLSENARKCITIEAKALAEIPASKRYDLVLAHGVAMYQSDPSVFLLQAAKLVKRGGLLSVIEKGYYGTEARLIREKDFAGLDILQKTRCTTTRLGKTAHAFAPEELEQLLRQQAKLKILEWSGMRVISDTLNPKITTLSDAQLTAIIDAEYEQGRNPTIRGQGQLLHFIARK